MSTDNAVATTISPADANLLSELFRATQRLRVAADDASRERCCTQIERAIDAMQIKGSVALNALISHARITY